MSIYITPNIYLHACVYLKISVFCTSPSIATIPPAQKSVPTPALTQMKSVSSAISGSGTIITRFYIAQYSSSVAQPTTVSSTIVLFTITPDSSGKAKV